MKIKSSERLQTDFSELIKTSGMIINDTTLPKLNKIEGEWEKFIKGKPINTDIVPKLIYDSWQRSMEYGVDPYLNNRELAPEEIRQQLLDSKSLVNKFGNIILGLQRMAKKNGSVVQLFDEEARNIQVLAFSNYYLRQELGMKNIYLAPHDASEANVGTTSISIAMHENKSVQVFGPEHFNKNLHGTYCSAAPIHNSKGEIIGALNIASYSYKQNKMDTLMLVTFLARLLDNISFTMDTLNELGTYDLAINRTIEYLPQGIVYIDNNNEIKHYNDKIVDMLGIEKANAMEELAKFVTSLQGYGVNDYIENKEISLKTSGVKKTFFISSKRLFDNDSKYEQRVILLEKAQKSNDKSQGNEATYTFNDLIGNNEAFIDAKSMAEKIAESAASVLLFGESGSGKELFAQAIHNASLRKNRPFVAINCGAIPFELVESELFGYDSGAFTGALKGGKVGKLETAYEGTLFLDEIESMPLNIQVKLLRALSTNKICRVGGVKEIPIDIRLISATKKDLLQESDDGNFREDLYYRISTFILNLPALRDRKDDIPILAKYYIDKFSDDLNLKEIKVDEEFYEVLSYYYWRGNIRELRNVIERTMILLGKETKLTKSYLPDKIIKAYNFKNLKNKISLIKSTKDDTSNLIKMSEEIIIEKLLRDENGNLSRVAERMGISRPTLNQKINGNEKLRNKVSMLRANNTK